MDAVYRVRFHVHRVDGASSALVLEGPDGALYLFADGALQARLRSLATWQRVSASLARARYAWESVECDALHSLGELPALAARSKRHGCRHCDTGAYAG